MLFQGSDQEQEVFQPLSNGLLSLHKGLKKAFDPHGILNPGKDVRDALEDMQTFIEQSISNTSEGKEAERILTFMCALWFLYGDLSDLSITR